MSNSKKSVLIIDDQESSIAVLTNILESEYTVYAAVNGKDGIRAAEKFLPDIILLDILMIDMDGYEVISILKDTEITKEIPVIFITALISDMDEEKGLIMGAADYIAKPFSPSIIKLRIRNQIRILEQLHTIEKLSMIDQLTDLPNRRSFEKRIHSEWKRAMREQTPISILMLDIDRFKNYNDTYGHLHGDVALRATADILSQALKRPADFAARWGGEEFITLLPNTDIEGAVHIAEEIRVLVENMTIPGSKDIPDTKITASIGVNTWTQEQTCTISELISGADSALYDAKKNGRNRVSRF